MVVEATTFETEARSNTLETVTCGESGSKVKWPKAFKAISLPPWVTAIEAAGNAPSAIASFRMLKALANSASCSWYAEATVAKDLAEICSAATLSERDWLMPGL